jgi:hypothetical protein
MDLRRGQYRTNNKTGFFHNRKNNSRCYFLLDKISHMDFYRLNKANFRIATMEGAKEKIFNLPTRKVLMT